MQAYGIIELEEGVLTVTRGQSDADTVEVLSCQRFALQDLSSDAVANVLRAVAGDLLEETTGVHVILGERRMQHFVSTLPKMPVGEVNGFIVREALRLTSMPRAEEVLVAPHILRDLGGGKLVVAASALPRSVWEPLREAFGACNLPVLSLNSMESCLALACETESDLPWAVVECSAGRARFVLCDGKSVVQVRRFMVGSSETSSEAFASQLAMELPRTVDWLREMGHEAPVTLVLGNRPGIGPESLDLTTGDVARVVRSAFSVEMEPDQDIPSLATVALLYELAKVGGVPSLLASPMLRLPPSKWRPVWLTLGVAAGVLCSFSALHDVRQLRDLWGQLAEVKTERERLYWQLSAIAGEASLHAPSSEDAEQLERVLSTRRPVSRLIAEVCNVAAPEVLIDGLQFASGERVVLTGTVWGATRTAALAVLAEFASSVQVLPYLAAGAQEDVFEVSGHPNTFRFRIGVSWRNS